MSFQVTFTGQVLVRNIFYSTKANRESEYFGEFCKKMDSLAKEINELIAEEKKHMLTSPKQEEIEALIEEKKEEIEVVVQKEFTQQMLDDCCDGGDEYYSTHYSGGRLEVDGEAALLIRLESSLKNLGNM